MFKTLQPLLAQRGIHILLSPVRDGKVGLYVEPVKLNDQEDNAFVTSFRCTGTPEELDAELPGVLAQWLSSRTAVTASLRDALAAAEAQVKTAAEESRKKASERNKKSSPVTGKAAVSTASKPTTSLVPAQAAVPSLFDGSGEDEDDASEGVAAPVQQVAGAEVSSPPATPEPAPAPAPAPAAIVTHDPVTSELF
jgi:PRTRC genetic system protein E